MGYVDRYLRPRVSNRRGPEIARETIVPKPAAAVDGPLVYLRAPSVAAACAEVASI